MIIKALTAELLAKILAVAVAALLVFGVWQYVSGVGYKAQAALLDAKVSKLEGSLSLAHANNATLSESIQRQNNAIEAAAMAAALRREAALASRDAAMEALKQARADYAELKDTWPADCVAAVSQVRRELGI
jgi:hypothetical protein